MANLLHRLFGGSDESDEPHDVPRANARKPTSETSAARPEPADFEAKRQPVRGRRKTRDETASIGPGEP